jgi:hypothetical protein
VISGTVGTLTSDLKLGTISITVRFITNSKVMNHIIVPALGISWVKGGITSLPVNACVCRLSSTMRSRCRWIPGRKEGRKEEGRNMSVERSQGRSNMSVEGFKGRK